MVCFLAPFLTRLGSRRGGLVLPVSWRWESLVLHNCAQPGPSPRLLSIIGRNLVSQSLSLLTCEMGIIK